MYKQPVVIIYTRSHNRNNCHFLVPELQLRFATDVFGSDMWHSSDLGNTDCYSLTVGNISMCSISRFKHASGLASFLKKKSIICVACPMMFS